MLYHCLYRLLGSPCPKPTGTILSQSRVTPHDFKKRAPTHQCMPNTGFPVTAAVLMCQPQKPMYPLSLVQRPKFARTCCNHASSRVPLVAWKKLPLTSVPACRPAVACMQKHPLDALVYGPLAHAHTFPIRLHQHSDVTALITATSKLTTAKPRKSPKRH